MNMQNQSAVAHKQQTFENGCNCSKNLKIIFLKSLTLSQQALFQDRCEQFVWRNHGRVCPNTKSTRIPDNDNIEFMAALH